MTEKFDIDAVRYALSRIAKTSDGEVLMSYLRRRYYDTPLNDQDLSRAAGRRDVVWDLNQLIERPEYGSGKRR